MKKIKSLEQIDIYSLLAPDLLEDVEVLEALKDKVKLAKALQPLYEILPYSENSMLSKEYVQRMEGMEWMADVEFDLIYATTTKKKISLSEEKAFLDKFLISLEQESIIIPEYISECGLPILALDTETTSLATNFKIYGGTLYKELDLIGVPIATSSDKGYYLPVGHNETDGIRNFSDKAIQYFLQEVSDRFFIVYFNFNYDSAVLHNLGIKLHIDKYSDVFHVSKAIGVDTLPDLGHSQGLKNQSKYFLDRKMLEINETVGSKTHIVFSRVCAKDAVSYACLSGDNKVKVRY